MAARRSPYAAGKAKADDAAENQRVTDHRNQEPRITGVTDVPVKAISFQLVIGLNCYYSAVPVPEHKHSG